MRLEEVVIKTKIVKLAPGLDKKEALKQALAHVNPSDYRGFKYNPKTGTAWLT